MSWLSKAFRTVKTKLRSLWSKVEPELEKTFQTFLETFGDIALASVMNAATKDISGSAKMKLVLNDLKGAVKTAGWTAGESALRVLVENTYVAYKASNGDKLVAPPGSSSEVVDSVGQ